MSSSASTVGLYLRSELLRRYFLVTSDPLTTVYMALTRTIGQANATGDQLDEPLTGGYSRAPYALGERFWSSSGYGEVVTTQDITFGQPTGPWGLVSGWALVTSRVSGLTLAVGRLTNPGTVNVDVIPVVPAGSCTVGLYD